MPCTNGNAVEVEIPTVVVEAKVTDEVINVSRTMQEMMVNANLMGRMAKMM